MIEQFWNRSIARDDRPLVPRNYVYASEIGGSMIDRFLKMNAVKPTNEPNDRAKRKMMAGNFTEAIVLYVFQRAGILQHSQKRFESSWTPLSIHGKSDVIIGGRVDFDQARSAAEQFRYFPEMHDISMKVIDKLIDIEYPETIYEVKSISTYKADYFEKDNCVPVPTHERQVGFYTIERMLPFGILSYICRDDLRMKEFYIHNTEKLKLDIYKDVETIKGYLEADERPPLEKLILVENGKFNKNFGVEYSNYLTMLYGFDSPRDYSEHVKSDIARYNRVLQRYKKGDKITDKNQEVREEIERKGYDFESLLSNFELDNEEEV